MDQQNEQKERVEKLAERLMAHPQMCAPIEVMLAMVEEEIASGSTADAVEQKVVAQVRALGRATLQSWADQAVRRARVDSTEPQPRARRHAKKKLWWLTTLGRIEVLETLWRARDGRILRPFCQQRAVRMRGSSRPLQRAMVDFGADEAFAGGAEKVREHYGVEVSVTRVREACLEQARRLTPRSVEPARTLAAQGPAALVAEADGTMIPVVDVPAAAPGVDRRKLRQVRWQEMRLVAAQAQGEVRTHYAATFGGPEETGALWSQVVREAGWAAATFIHGLGDGAEWIAEQFRQHFGAHGRYTLDLFHGCEYLAAAAPQPSASAPFVHQAREALRDNRASEVLGELALRLEAADLPESDAPVRRAHRYLSKRLDQLDYKSALQRNLPIGSGLIESGHRHVLQARLKLPGAWWKPDNAHAMAQLRVCRANGHWQALWSN